MKKQVIALMFFVLMFCCRTSAAAKSHQEHIRARPLDLSNVRLLGGPLKQAQDLDARYLLELEPDRMLAYYRQRADLEPKAKPYTGWDGGGRNLTGHIAGHYLSAVSLMWAATADVRFKERADYLVKELKEVQDKHGNTQEVTRSSPARFYDVEYPLAADMVEGKEKVTVRFQAGEGDVVAAVFGIRMIGADAER